MIGSGSDRLELRGQNSAFDLDQIVSGFTQIVVKDFATWRLSGSLAAATTIESGELRLDGAVTGDTVVGDASNFYQAKLGGSGTVGTRAGFNRLLPVGRERLAQERAEFTLERVARFLALWEILAADARELVCARNCRSRVISRSMSATFVSTRASMEARTGRAQFFHQESPLPVKVASDCEKDFTD